MLHGVKRAWLIGLVLAALLTSGGCGASGAVARPATNAAASHAPPALREEFEALREARRNPGPSGARLLVALRALGRAQEGLNRHADAAQSFLELLPIVFKNHGRSSPEAREALTDLGVAYYLAHDVEHAQLRLDEALAIAEVLAVQDPAGLADSLYQMARLDSYVGREQEAKRRLDRAIELAHTAGLKSHEAAYLRLQARILVLLGPRQDAEAMLRRALALDQSVAPDGLAVADDLDALGENLLGQRRHDEAIVLYRQSLALFESKLRPGDPGYIRVPNTLIKLAGLFATALDFARAYPLYERAIALHKAVEGDDSLSVGLDLVLLANVYMLAGDQTSAQQRLEQAVATLGRVNAPENVTRPALETAAKLLLTVKDRQARSHAFALYKRMAEDDRKAGDERTYASNLAHMGVACMGLDDRDCAIDALQRSLEVDLRVREPGDLALGTAHSSLALGYYAFNEFDLSVDEFDAALRTVVERGNIVDDARQLPLELPTYLDALWRASRPPKASRYDRASTGLLALQYEQRGRAALAVAHLGARLATGNDELAGLVRQEQDLRASRAALERLFGEAWSVQEQPKRERALTELRARLADNDAAHRALQTQMTSRYPAYKQLVAPPVVAPEALRALLGAGEVLLTFNFGPSSGTVWAITREGISWSQVRLSQAELAREVRALRESLNPLKSAQRGLIRDSVASPPRFDRDRAFRLYRALFDGVAEPLRTAKRLIVVPDGALESLPLSVLVTRDPTNSPQTFDGYRDTAWLIRQVPIATLPSLSALASLRRAGVTAPPGAFVGVGRPLLSATIARSLEALPETEEELRRIAKLLSKGRTDGDLLLGSRATEEVVKAAKLDAYRIVAFATHGLTATELGALGGPREPALVLSAPSDGSSEDGFLTASEVATLHLNADWVILSACNTAAGDGSAEEQPFSGLSRAFFYAGAKALLVSHWSVASRAAVDLTTGLFAALGRTKAPDRASALQQAMIAVMNQPQGSDPAYWAPFTFMGEAVEGANSAASN